MEVEEALATARQHAYLAGAPPPDPAAEDKSVVLSFEVSPDGLNATYSLTHEDHTLGNALRYILSQNLDCSFVGYSMPHPAEPLIKIRLQRHEDEEPAAQPAAGAPVHQLMRQGLEDLIQMCEIAKDKYRAALAAAPADDQMQDVNSDDE